VVSQIASKIQNGDCFVLFHSGFGLYLWNQR